MDSKQLLRLRRIVVKTDIGFILIAPELYSSNKIENQTNAFRCHLTYLTLSLARPKSQFGFSERLANATSNSLAWLSSSKATASLIARSVSSTKCAGCADTIRSTVATLNPARFWTVNLVRR